MHESSARSNARSNFVLPQWDLAGLYMSSLPRLLETKLGYRQLPMCSSEQPQCTWFEEGIRHGDRTGSSSAVL